MNMATKLSAKEAATEIGTDARTLRKFIRGSKNLPISPVGQGARYEFTPKEVKALKKAFLAWSSGTKKTEKPKNETFTDDAGDTYEEILPLPEDDDTKDENGFTDQDYADHQDIDLDTYEGTTALDDLDGPTDEDLESDIEDEIELDDEDLDIE